MDSERQTLVPFKPASCQISLCLNRTTYIGWNSMDFEVHTLLSPVYSVGHSNMESILVHS